jgi:cytoskeletal protein CcmA (bactofilin family)
MFSKGKKKLGASVSDAREDAPTAKAVPSIISADLSLEGNIVSNGEVQIDGAVKGDIQCKALIVGVKGSVAGEVTAQSVRMHGSIKGMIRAKSVFLASTARMSGDVEHESLAIEPGAFMEGHCKRIAETAIAPVAEPARRVEPPKPTTQVTSVPTPPRVLPNKGPKPAIAAT